MMRNLVDNLPSRNVYRGGSTPGDTIADRQISVADVQPFNANAPFPVSIQCDWVYSDPFNPAPCVIDVTSPGSIDGDQYQSQTFTLRPGDAFTLPFRNASIGTTRASSRVRLLYGKGPCPFTSSYSAHSGATSTLPGTTYPQSWPIPNSGIVSHLSIRCSRITVGTEISRLRPRFSFQNSITGAFTGLIYPDFLQADDISLVVGQANTFAVWRDIPIPQAVGVGNAPLFFDRLVVDVLEIGTAVTNAIARTGFSDNLVLR